eukprot:CAMPEP_0198107936 /NCGR_PEP_ID=MMETSP1442-20131203/26_1 /TAXON_ID= /ORGANISM="Craspedostauros australis, Strain CCMP3328" /LENGTH=394 /DNA_ID=CAMNT_0043763111 /DNA_START=85 /DNA_END=1269 /DNA_ORIENTATION=+
MSSAIATSPTPEQRAKLYQRRQHNDPTIIHPMRVMIGRTTLQLEREVRLRCALKEPALRIGPFFFFHTSRKQVVAPHRHLITMHNVKVAVIKAHLCNSHRLPEIRDGMRVLIKGFENDPRPKVINDVYQPWLLDMLVSSSIDVMDYINIEKMGSISSEASRWLVDRAKTVQLMHCTFEDSGLAFCRRLNEPSCVVDTIKFLDTTIVGSMFGNAVASSTTLTSLNIQDKRQFVEDGLWTDIIKGTAANRTIKSMFLCGSYRDSSTLNRDLITILSCECDRKFSLFLTPYVAPSKESQTELCEAIVEALRESRHLIDMNHLFPVINVNDWNNKIKPLIERNGLLRNVRSTMQPIQRDPRATLAMFNCLVQKNANVRTSPDAIYNCFRDNFVYFGKV